MPRDTLLLVGPDRPRAAAVLGTHAERLRDREVAGTVRVATYGPDPVDDVRSALAADDPETVYAVPVVGAHTRDTTRLVPDALGRLPGTVEYCDPVGYSPAVTDVLLDRATTALSPGEDATLVVVGFGSSAADEHGRAAAAQAERLRERGAYGAVTACYLLCNPAAECARYDVGTARAVAVPLFVTPCQETETEIPAKLELDRGGLAYGAPLGTHERVTDAIHAEVERRRVLSTEARGADTPSVRSVATDGRGPR